MMVLLRGDHGLTASLHSSQVLWFPLLETMMASQKQGKGLNAKYTFQGKHMKNTEMSSAGQRKTSICLLHVISPLLGAFPTIQAFEETVSAC